MNPFCYTFEKESAQDIIDSIYDYLEQLEETDTLGDAAQIANDLYDAVKELKQNIREQVKDALKQQADSVD